MFMECYFDFLTYIHLKKLDLNYLCWLQMNQKKNTKIAMMTSLISKICPKGSFWGSKEIYIGLILGEWGH